MKSTNDTAQKQKELVWFHKFREHCPVCPRSVPEQPNPPAPDILFPDDSLGIELTTYLLGQGSSGSHPHQLEVIREKILREAQAAIETNAKPCLQVSVIWSPDLCPGQHEHKRLVQRLAGAVAARTGHNQGTQRGCRVNRQDLQDPELQRYVEEIGIYVMPDKGQSCWSSVTGLCFGTSEAPVNRIGELLARKEARVATYLKSCHEVWLLIIAEGQWFSSSIGSHQPLLQTKFESSFNRVFVLDERYAQVFELTINQRC